MLKIAPLFVAIVTLGVSLPACAGSGGAGAAAGFSSALPDAQMKWACAEALRQELAGGPASPLACAGVAGTPSAVYAPPQPTVCFPVNRGAAGTAWICR